MAFKQIGSLNPHGSPILRKEIITNSVVSKVNDSMKLVSGFASLGTTGALVAGHLITHKSDRGVGLISSGAAGAQIGSYTNTFTAAATNQTVAKVRAEMDISSNTIYSVTLNAAIGTTTGSNLSGYYTDIADETQSAESSALTTTNQYTILGVDPKTVANQMVVIHESFYYGV